MRIQELFAVPAGKKVTEKVLGKVLLSSVCSILLCMACLAGTTWALFVVSIENTENVIQIANTPQFALTVDGQDFVSGEELPNGEHIVRIEHASDVDDLQQKSTLYVTLILDETTCGYIMLCDENSYKAEVGIVMEEPCTFSWVVSWFEPGNAELLIDSMINLSVEAPADPTEESTESTEGTTEPTEGATDPTEGTTQPTEEATEATEETTEVTEETTEATEEATLSTEETSASTESAAPSAPGTETDSTES